METIMPQLLDYSLLLYYCIGNTWVCTGLELNRAPSLPSATKLNVFTQGNILPFRIGGILLNKISHVTAPSRNGIDIVKFICSILVVAIHIPVLNPSAGGELTVVADSFNTALNHSVCRVAVPFFFTCSGYLLFSKMPAGSLDWERIKNYCFKILRLLGVWTVLLFLGSSGHLWYLGATVVAVLFLSLCLHYHIRLPWLIALACILYVLGLLGDSYRGFLTPFVSKGILRYLYAAYDFIVGTSRNGLFMGYIFILIGYWFAQNKVKFSAPISLVGFVVSLLCLCAESFLLDRHQIPDDNNMYISLLPVTFFLFAFASSLSLKDRPIYKKLRTVGVLVYFLHLFVDTGVWAMKQFLYKFLRIDIQPFQFFISLAMTILLAFGIEWLSRKEKFKWIRWILS